MSSNSRPPAPQPYGSAEDLPSFVELRQLIKGGKLITRVIGREHRQKIIEVERQLKELTSVVDGFYGLLGPRHWVFHDSLSVPEVKALLALPQDDAERQFIELYTSDMLRRSVRQLNRHDALRVRMPLIELALRDYEEHRYYSTVLVLLSVMDGFVNDIEQDRRRGLHARDAEEMVAWDSVVGHHLGLAHAHKTFTRSTSKTTTDEVYELHRNGIMHGTLLNFNNDVVATKAWNRLFAVADWATSREKQSIESPRQPTLRESLGKLTETEAARRAISEWSPSVLTRDDDGFRSDEVLLATSAFLDAWTKRNYGAMAAMLSSLVALETASKTAGRVREEYEGQTLDVFEIVRISHEAAAICEVDLILTLDGQAKPARIRWIREGSDGQACAPNEQGAWRVMSWGPHAMVNRASAPS